jgi:hypothetical protein
MVIKEKHLKVSDFLKNIVESFETNEIKYLSDKLKNKCIKLLLALED